MRGAEEDATFASQGAQQLERSIAAYRVLLCCELVGAVRLLRQRGLDGQFSGAVSDALALADVLPRDNEDRDLRGDIALAESLLDDIGQLVPVDTHDTSHRGLDPTPSHRSGHSARGCGRG